MPIAGKIHAHGRDIRAVGQVGRQPYRKLRPISGWDTPFAGRPTVQWLLPSPLILEESVGHTNDFSFIISWATSGSVVVEAATDFNNPVWSPLATNTLTGGSFYFSEPDWTNYPRRFYRIRSP